MDRNDLELTRKQCVSQMLSSELTIVTLQGAIKQIDVLLSDKERFPVVVDDDDD